MSAPLDNRDFQQKLDELFIELEEINANNGLIAFAFTAVYVDGVVRTHHSRTEHQAFPLLAGITLLQHDFIADLKKEQNA